MFHFFNGQQRSKSRKNTKKSTIKVDLDILKNVTQIVDETAFQQNLYELYEYIGIKQLDSQSQTYKDLRHYLINVLQFPSKSLAQLHRSSHRLGTFDKLSQQENLYNPEDKSQQATLIDQLDNCPCCGLRKQYEQLKICSTLFKDLQIVGISTYMFFRTLRNLLYFLVLALIVFGAFSFASNIKCSNLWNNSNILKTEFFRNTILISLGSKIYLALNEEYNDLLIWQVWLGLAMVALFMVGYVWMERVQVKELTEIDYKIKSVSDYSVVIKGVPAGITKGQLQQALDTQFQQNIPQNVHKIVKINFGTPLNISSQIENNRKKQFIELQKRIVQYRLLIFSWIEELRQNKQFITSREQRQKIIEQYQKAVKQSKKKQQQIVNKVKQLYQQNKVDTLTNCYVTFQSKRAKQHLLSSLSSSPFDKFLQYLTFNVYQKTIKLQLGRSNDKHQFNVKIQQASEPQDIIWENNGMRTVDLIIRKCITFLFTFILLAMSFAIVYGLSTVQVKNQDNRYISFLISLIIVVFNFIISVVLAIFTAFELNSTHTDYQSSYAVKAIFAQLINTILIPILVNRFLKKENYIYTTSGLAEDIFLLGLSSAFIKPLITMFDPYYFFIKYLKVWYYDRPKKKALLSQVQFNKIHELILFQDGYEYIYIISLYLWTCFFMSLQPVIIGFSILGLIFNYWANKYSLFHRCKRPVPGTRILYDTMVQFVYSGGLFYSLGSLTFINLIPKDIFETELNYALIANLIAVGLSVLSIFIPFSYLYAIFFDSEKQEKEELYEQNRIFFPAQYDRMNPATSQKAIQQFLGFINDKKVQLHQKLSINDPEIKKMFTNLYNQSRNVYERGYGEYNLFNNFISHKNKLTQLLNPKLQIVHPQVIQNFLVGDIYENFINNNKNQVNNLRNEKQNQQEKNYIQNEKGSNERLQLQDNLVHRVQKRNFNNDQNIFPQEDPNGNIWMKNLQQQLYKKFKNIDKPLFNQMNYTISPYNPKALEQFKNKTNKMFINKQTSSKIIH